MSGLVREKRHRPMFESVKEASYTAIRDFVAVLHHAVMLCK